MMVLNGHVENGVIVLDGDTPLIEGTAVRVDVPDSGVRVKESRPLRKPGRYAGQIWIAPDFDEWPEDMRERLGLNP